MFNSRFWQQPCDRGQAEVCMQAYDLRPLTDSVSLASSHENALFKNCGKLLAFYDTKYSDTFFLLYMQPSGYICPYIDWIHFLTERTMSLHVKRCNFFSRLTNKERCIKEKKAQKNISNCQLDFSQNINKTTWLCGNIPCKYALNYVHLRAHEVALLEVLDLY